MKIHKDFLTHDGVAPATTGKVIDLGFNGDFDHKKTDWNMVFIQFPAKASGTAMTVKIYSKQSDIATSPVIVNDSNLIGTITVPAATVQKGGIVGLPMPKNLKRYFAIGITGTTLPATVTAGITDEVDTNLDCYVNGSAFWTNYKASTGTTEVPQRATRVGDVISGSVDARITALED